MLDKNQVHLIESDVESARITLENLSQELIDHICCEVENQMNNGKSFEEAYALIKAQTGIEVLQKIQENTLYLIDKKYAIMKTTMKITGNVSLALLAMGTLFKIFHWPGASIALVLGFTLLCLVFFPAAIYINHRDGNNKGKTILNFSILIGGISLMAGILFKVMHWPGSSPLMLVGWLMILLVFLPLLLINKLKEATNSKEKWTYIIGAIALVLFEFGAMFKMFHWPGAGPLLIVGSILLISVFLPMFTNIKFKESAINAGQFVFIVTISMYAVVLTSLLALNVSSDILARFVNVASNSSKIIHYFEKKKELHSPITNGSTDSLQVKYETRVAAISEEADKLQDLIMNIKLELIEGIDKVDKETALTSIASPNLIHEKSNVGDANALFFGEHRNSLVEPLKEQLDAFRKNVCVVTESNSELSQKINTLLGTSTKAGSWEEANFRGNPLISIIARLSAIEKNVRMVESAVIQHVQKQNS